MARLVKFIDRDPHCYTRMGKEATHIRLHPQYINRDQQRTAEGTATRRNNKTERKDRDAPITTGHRDINGTVQSVDFIGCRRLAVLTQSERRDQHPK